jgi:hypothetical protein
LPNIDNYAQFDLKTEISGTRMQDVVMVNVRGTLVQSSEMPLYLDQGACGQQYIYPIFDWTDLQVSAAIIAYNL